jgi:hypothetical protein
MSQIWDIPVKKNDVAAKFRFGTALAGVSLL